MGFDTGITWLRLLPPLVTANRQSAIIEFATYSLEPGSFGVVPELVVPTSLGNVNANDPIPIFERFLDINYPYLLTKNTKNWESGLKLDPYPRAACMVYLFESPVPMQKNQFPCRLWIGSSHPGGGITKEGVIHQLIRLQKEKRIGPGGNNHGLRYGDLSDPTSGRLIGVTVTRATPKSVPCYESIAVDESPTPISCIEGLFRIHPKAGVFLKPVEEMLHIPSEDEIHTLLRDAIDWKIARGKLQPIARQAYADCFGAFPRTAAHTVSVPVAQSPTPNTPLAKASSVTIPPVEADLPLIDDLDAPIKKPDAKEIVPAPAIVSTPSPKAVSEQATPDADLEPKRMASQSVEPIRPKEEPLGRDKAAGTTPIPAKCPTDEGIPASTDIANIDPFTAPKDVLLKVIRMASQGVKITNIDEFKTNLVFRFAMELTDEESKLVYVLD